MAGYKPRVISLNKRSGQSFGFYLRAEHGEDGHLVRCLEMGGNAELAGMRDGDRILRVNGTFVDGLSHSEVVEMVKSRGSSVTFHILDEASYNGAKAQGVNLADPNASPVSNGMFNHAPKPKLCYLVKSKSGYGFSLRSVNGHQGLFMTEVLPGGVADRAGVRLNDRLLEINGDAMDSSSTHDQAVEKIKSAGGSLMFLLADEETDRHYQSKYMNMGAWLATTQYLPHKPKIAEMNKGNDGYGFLLKEEPMLSGHFVRDIERGSPAEQAGLQDMDRLVAVDGKEVDGFSHEQVVDCIRMSGRQCSLLVVDKETDQMYRKGNVSPMLFWEEMKSLASPPSYNEAVTIPAAVRPPSPVQEKDDDLKPKLCRMEKTSAGYGFHLNGIQGVCGQYIKEVVRGGAADRAGLEDDDMVVEVNGVNVEKSNHEEVVALIRRSGSSLELLVASRSVYERLVAKGVPITRALLGETSYAQVHTPETMEVRPETPPAPQPEESETEPARSRSSSESSCTSEDSVDERF
uniref:PDZ domain containing 1 n=1 Tax=Neogobius melanostomus TaxID=47308 RepID=A0A8C6TGD2_9GOBI